MHREERRICYSNAELMDALALFCEHEHRTFNFDHSASFTFSNSPALKVRVANWNNQADGVEFPEPEIETALVLFSKTLGIPVPKKATKSLEFARDNIIFVMHIEHEA